MKLRKVLDIALESNSLEDKLVNTFDDKMKPIKMQVEWKAGKKDWKRREGTALWSVTKQ